MSKALFYLLFVLLFVTNNTKAATYYARQNGNWSDPATWSLSCGGPAASSIPGATDDVVITCNLNNRTITVDGNYSCNNLILGSANRDAILQITTAGNSLTINGSLSINTGNFNRTYRLNAGSGNITINNISYWATSTGTNEIAVSTGVINFNTNVNLSSAQQSINFNGAGTINFNQNISGLLTRILTVANCNINFYGNVINTTAAANFNATSNSRFYGNSNAITANADITFGRTFFMSNSNYNITNASGNVIFGHDITLSSASTLVLSKGIIVNRSWINNGGTFNGGTHFVRFLGIPSTAYQIGGTHSTTFPDVFFGNANGSTRFRYNINRNIIVNNLTLEDNNVAATSFIRNNTGNPLLTVNGNVTIKQLNANSTNSWLINAGSGIVNGNLIFQGTSNTTSRIARVIVTSGSFTLNGNITWMSNTEVATEVISTTTGTLTFNNSINLNRGTGRIRVQNAGGTVYFNGNTLPSLELNNGTGTNAEFFTAAGTNIYFNRGIRNYNVTLTLGNNSNTYFTGNAEVLPSALISFANLYIQNAASLNLLGNINIRNNWINNGGTFAANTSTVTFNGNVSQNIQEINPFYSLTASTAGNTIICNTNLTISNTLNMTGHHFNLNGNTLTLGNGAPATLTVSGNRIAYNGTFRRYWPSSTAISSTTAPLYGLFPVGVQGSYRPVTINSTSNPTSAGYISVTHNDSQSAIDISYNDAGNLIQRISGQNATINVSGVSGGTYNLRVQYAGFSNPGGSSLTHYRMITYTGGTPNSVGTHVGATGSVAAPLGGRNALTISQLNNVFVMGTTNALATPILRIYYARKSGNWNDGSSDATWSTIAPGGASCNCTPPANAIVTIKNGYSVNLNVNATVNDLFIDSAQLVGTNNLTVNNDLIINGTGSFNPTSGNWIIGKNLIINGSGTSNFSNGTNQILGNIENNATLNFGSSTSPLQVRGNWTNNGTFNAQNGTVLLNGTSSQIITGNTRFNNLTIQNSSGVSISSGSIIEVKNTLAINSGTFNTNDNLILLSDSTGTARIAPLISGADLVGDITMQRYVHDSGFSDPLGKWREIGSPVIGATFSDWQDDFTTWGLIGSNGFSINDFISIYEYDETVTDISDSGYVSPDYINDVIEHKKGYWAYIDNTPLTIDVKGAPGKGTVNFNVTYTSSSAGVDHDGWNLVANPYPSPINWDAAGWTKTNIEDAIYVWNPTLQQYASYAGGVGVNGGTAHIASSQAFWVHAIGSSPSLIATENVKSSVDGTFKNNNITPPRGLLISIEGNGFSDETAIRFSNNASNNFDNHYDATKLWSFNANVPSISSVMNNIDYSINTLSEFEEDITIPIRVWTYVSSNFTLKVNLSDFPYHNACIFLEDLQTGAITDLRVDSTYSCFIPDTTDLPRFLLHISKPIKAEISNPTCTNQSNGQIVIKGTGNGPWNYVWKDINGNIIHAENNTTVADTLMNLSAGLYIIEVQNTLCGNYVDTIEVVNPSPIQLNYNITEPLCKNSNDGVIDINVFGGNEPYTYLWSSGDSVQDLSNAGAGMIALTVTDANGCTNSFSFVLNAQNPLSAEFNCADTVWLQNGIANVNFINQSVGADSYEWDFDDGNEIETAANPTYTFTAEGVYNIRLKATNATCEDIYEKEIVVLSEQPNSITEKENNTFNANAFIQDNNILIAFEGILNEALNINLVDKLGRNIVETIILKDYSSLKMIPVSNLASGIYYLKLQNSLYNKTIKLSIP
ncbi:MAG: PKD domain-containing protein [Bacteroidia bacterium]